MKSVLLIFLGGGIGSAGRYAIGGLAHLLFGASFPVGTLSVNLIGSFIIGALWECAERFYMPSDLRTFLFIGFLGGFTTFSTYSVETVNLLRENEIAAAATNVLLNNILGFALVILGILAFRFFAGLTK